MSVLLVPSLRVHFKLAVSLSKQLHLTLFQVLGMYPSIVSLGLEVVTSLLQ